MSEQTSTFVVRVEDEADGALTVAEKLDRLANDIRGSENQIASMGKALRNLKGGGSEAAGSIEKLKTEIALHKAAVAQSTAAYVQLGGTFSATAAQADKARAAREAEKAQALAATEQAKAEANAAREAAKAAADHAREVERTTKAAALAAAEQRRLAEAAAKLATDEQAAVAQAREFSAALDRLRNAKPPELAEAIKRDTAEIARLEIALRSLGPANDQTRDRIAALNAQLGAQKTSVEAARLRLQQLGATGSDVKPAMVTAAGSIKGLADAVSKIPGPIGQAGDDVKKLADLLKSGFVAGALLGVAAAAALVIGVTALAASWFKFGFAASSARRDQDLTTASLVASRRQLLDVAGTVAHLNSEIANTAAATGATRAATAGYARSLFEAGLRGEQLQTALKGAAITGLAMGEQHAATFVKNAAALKGNSEALNKYAGLVETRLGGIATKRAQSFGNQIVKLKESIAGLFSGLKLDKFLEALSKITDMFSEQSATGAALKQIFESLFQPMVDGAANNVPLVKRFIQGLVIAALSVAIVFVKIRNSIRDAFEGSSLGKIDKMKLALDAGKAAAFAFVAVIGLAAGIVATLGAALYIAIRPLISIGKAVVGAVAAVRVLVTAFTESKTAIADMDWGSLGKAIVLGIVGGLTPGPIGTKMQELGTEAWKSFKDSVKIGSPSKLFRVQGGANIASSVALGVEDKKPLVRRKMTALVEPPQATEVRQQTRRQTAQGVQPPPAVQALASLRVGSPEPPTGRRPAPPPGLVLPRPEPRRQRLEPAFSASLDVGSLVGGLFSAKPETPKPKPPAPPRPPAPPQVQPLSFDAPPAPVQGERKAPPPGAPPPPAAGAATINLGGVTITINAGNDATAKQLAAEVEPEFSSMLREIAARIGA